jgi:hypothetical protein
MTSHRLLPLTIILILTTTSTTIATNDHQQTTPLTTSHLITNVPYVAQTKKNYCVYADLAMILDHLGLNTTIDELVFYGGVGYSHTYSTATRLPHENLYANLDFTANLFGLTHTTWWTDDTNLTSDQRWDQFYTMLTDNISHDTPVAAGVNPFDLPSLQDQYPTHNLTWHLLLPQGRHVILLIGYNTTNHTVCYQDPNAGYYGDPSYGDHAWMTDSTLRAARETSEISFCFTYTPEGPPLPKDTAFQLAFHRNIAVLSGTPPLPGTGLYGINATTQMLHDYTTGTNTSHATILLYKTYGKTSLDYHLNHLAHQLLTTLYPGRLNVFDIIINGEQNPFDDIARDKQHTADYLANSTIQPSLCQNQSRLLRQEASKWNLLASSYTQFLKKGLLLSNVKAQLTITKMEQLTQDIHSIEEQLINIA